MNRETLITETKIYNERRAKIGTPGHLKKAEKYYGESWKTIAPYFGSFTDFEPETKMCEIMTKLLQNPELSMVLQTLIDHFRNQKQFSAYSKINAVDVLCGFPFGSDES